MKKRILIIVIVLFILSGLSVLGIYLYRKNANNHANSEFIINDTLVDGDNKKS